MSANFHHEAVGSHPGDRTLLHLFVGQGPSPDDEAAKPPCTRPVGPRGVPRRSPLPGSRTRTLPLRRRTLVHRAGRESGAVSAFLLLRAEASTPQSRQEESNPAAALQGRLVATTTIGMRATPGSRTRYLRLTTAALCLMSLSGMRGRGTAEGAEPVVWKGTLPRVLRPGLEPGASTVSWWRSAN